MLLFFKVLMNLSAMTSFLSLYAEYICIAFFSNNDVIGLLKKSRFFIWLAIRSF